MRLELAGEVFRSGRHGQLELMAQRRHTLPARPSDDGRHLRGRRGLELAGRRSLVGIVTDRDIAIRVVAEREDPSTPVGDVCSERNLATLRPDAPVAEAVELMRDKAIRGIPVLDGGTVIGVVSLGDLAVERDPGSVLAAISAAESNR